MADITGQYQNRPPQNQIFTNKTLQQADNSGAKTNVSSQSSVSPSQENAELRRKFEILAAFASVQNKIIEKLVKNPDSKSLQSQSNKQNLNCQA